ncbi:RND family efflux transporter, MFP subunit [Chitinophaga rupis]|uniref:RND family efflux transporter, MFP subunit n=1 Tax=Chitinophaga rupis TaxID=573321 RepID=A0A1H7H7V8_9BACT|nr:efflux RND transporter periplasmic adaptor subunit [Chitinophaga rupis]SEK45080.1 RND family efflux transporter, MFP subunit [Chitinophaga rupis]
MNRTTTYFLTACLLLTACTHKKKEATAEADPVPKVENDGKRITFTDTAMVSFFQTEPAGDSALSGELHAPARIAATVLTSQEGAQNVVLFDNPDLESSYTQLMQHMINIRHIQDINIKQRKIELDRAQDLFNHGAATGKDLLDAQAALSMEQTNLANERAAIIEHEARLKAGGFEPVALRTATPGTAYVICDIPETQISNVKEGNVCSMVLPSFPEMHINGKIENVADVIDNTTRMVKLRIRISNPGQQLKAGMFATVTFPVKPDPERSSSNMISINKSALITSQGRSYVFVKTAPSTFERKEVSTGLQIGDRVNIYKGLERSEQVVVNGVMQLKGLSFGY